MILWLNGPFGVGKTATAQCIVAAHAGWRLFDPETVGYMLKANLRDHDIADFQDLDAWRALVPRVAAELNTLTRTDLVAVQTVLVERYWSDLRAGAAFLGVDIFHVLLDCREDVLRGRLHHGPAGSIEPASGWPRQLVSSAAAGTSPTARPRPSGVIGARWPMTGSPLR